jgi:hypothetical protein
MNMPQLLFVLLVVLVTSMSVVTIVLCINIITNVIMNREKIEEDKTNIIVEL